MSEGITITDFLMAFAYAGYNTVRLSVLLTGLHIRRPKAERSF